MGHVVGVIKSKSKGLQIITGWNLSVAQTPPTYNIVFYYEIFQYFINVFIKVIKNIFLFLHGLHSKIISNQCPPGKQYFKNSNFSCVQLLQLIIAFFLRLGFLRFYRAIQGLHIISYFSHRETSKISGTPGEILGQFWCTSLTGKQIFYILCCWSFT